MAQGKQSVQITEFRQRARRWLHDVERKKKKERVQAAIAAGRAKPKEHDFQLRKRYQSIPLRLMANRCAEHLPSDASIAGRFSAPKIFSLHHNPQESLRALFRIAKYARSNHKILRINVYLGNVEVMDLAADSLLGILLKEMKNESFGVRNSQIRGSYPSSPEIRREMEEIGTVKVLKTDPGKENVEVDFSRDDVKVYRHRESGVEISRSIDSPETVEKVTREFSDHVDRCLKTIGQELNEAGRRNLCGYVGEVLTNAQEHAGFTDWTIVGYLDANAKVFKVVVINFGDSYEDTFLSLDKSTYTWKQVGGYVGRHSEPAQRRFGMSVGTLVTVAALQERISSKNVSSASTRGQGTVQMIEFFQRIYDLGSEKGAPVEMALISGSTHISFDGSYKLSRDERTGRNAIAFNKDNSLNQLPDGKVVKTMPGVSFPGTIISISFPLAKEMQIREVQ